MPSYFNFFVIFLLTTLLQSHGQLFDNLLSQILPSSLSSSTASPVSFNQTIELLSISEESMESSWNPLEWFHTRPKEPLEYNPDTDLTTTEFAIRYGYSAEAHTVKTKDGYLLTLHRIPCGKFGCKNGRGRGQPVFLQHGLLESSIDWLMSGPDRALALILADMGYDVWLGNARGSTYSKKHVEFNTKETKYWDFSWHEMALYDISAEIDYLYEIRNNEQLRYNGTPTQTNNLLYVAHSMGTTMVFALLSEHPEYNDKIKAIFAMAPVVFMSNIKSPLRLLAPFSEDIEMVIKFFGAKEFLPKNKMLSFLSNYACELTDAERYICENTVFVLSGFDKMQYNATLMPVILAHTPAGTSTKTVVHYTQEIREGGIFQQFDYGMEKNRIRYGQDSPPKYRLENVRIPVMLIYATNDWLAGSQDTTILYEKLSNFTTVEMFRVPINEFNHLDFLWGKNATKLVYAPLIERMILHN